MKKSFLFVVFLVVVCVCFGGCRVEKAVEPNIKVKIVPCPKTIEIPYVGEGVEFWWYIPGKKMPLYPENPSILKWAKGKVLLKKSNRECAWVLTEWSGGGKAKIPDGDWEMVYIEAKKDNVLLWDFKWTKEY